MKWKEKSDKISDSEAIKGNYKKLTQNVETIRNVWYNLENNSVSKNLSELFFRYKIPTFTDNRARTRYFKETWFVDDSFVNGGKLYESNRYCQKN